MTESAIVGRGGNDTLATASTTRYSRLVGESDFDGNGTATEANAQLKWRNAGTAQNLYIQVPTNGRSTASTLTLRQGGADSALSISITGSTTGQFTDLSTVSIADGDLLNYALTTGTGTGSINVTSCAFEMVTSGQCGTMLAGGTPVGMTAVTATSSTRFTRPNADDASWGTNETGESVYFPVACTLSNLQFSVSANTWGSACTIKSRKNGADGGQSISIPATTTGFFEDTTNTDSLAAGDRVGFAIVTPAGSGSITTTTGGFLAKSSTANKTPLLGPYFSTLTTNALYLSLYGGSGVVTAEASAESRTPIAVVLSNMYVHVASNASTTTVTVVSRVNGANGNQSISISASATGLFEDTTNTDSLAAGDLFAYQVSTSTTGVLSGSTMGGVATFGTSGVYTLTAGSASYAVTGTAAGLARSRIMAGASGSYALLGTAAAFAKGKRIAADTAAYAQTGTAAAFSRTRNMAAASAAYALTGTNAGLQRALKLVAGSASYAVIGTDAAFRLDRVLAANTAGYALSGTDASLRSARLLAALSGSYAVTGTAATLTAAGVGAYTLPADSASYVLTGATVVLKAGRSLAGDSAAYALTGSIAAMRAARRIAADTAAYAVTGTAAGLRRTSSLPANTAAYALTGTATALRAGRNLAGATASYALTGTAALFSRGRPMMAGSGSYSLDGQTVGFRTTYVISAESGVFILTGQVAALTWSNAPFWVPAGQTGETWSSVAANSETWTPVSATAETWTAA